MWPFSIYHDMDDDDPSLYSPSSHWKFIAYIVEGLVMAVVHGLLAATLLLNPALRSKYTILIPVSVTDCLSGVAAVAAGAGRLSVILSGDMQPRSMQYCALMPWNILFMWTDPMAAVVQLIVSIDRLLSLTIPIHYYKLSSTYQFGQAGAWHVAWLLIMAAAWTCTFSFAPSHEIFKPICWFDSSVLPLFVNIWLIVRISAAVAAVVLYVVVFMLFRIHKRKMADFSEPASRRGRKLTLTMLLSCVSTLTLFVLPIASQLAILNFVQDKAVLEVSIVYTRLSTGLNPLVNAAIILIRHVDIRHTILLRRPSSINGSG